MSNTGDRYIKRSLSIVTCPNCGKTIGEWQDNTSSADFPYCPYCQISNQGNLKDAD